jgi:uncharacterized membrane protein
MSDARDALIEWTQAGVLARDRLHDAQRAAGVVPGAAQWRSFTERLLVSLGAVLVAAGACYFIAANWQALGRFAKFGLIEGAIVAALALVAWRGLDTIGGRAALIAASLLLGVLLALVGQTYQTGADSYELFVAWALCILPWVVVGREPALWVVWLALVDLAIVLYSRTSVARGLGELGLLFMPRTTAWWLLATNGLALAIWESFAPRVAWMAGRWGPRVVATSIGALVTFVAVADVLEIFRRPDYFGIVAYVAFAAVMLWVYRVLVRDVYMLAGVVASGVIVVGFACGRWLIDRDFAGGFLITGIVVVACAAAGSYWLRSVGREAGREP